MPGSTGRCANRLLANWTDTAAAGANISFSRLASPLGLFAGLLFLTQRVRGLSLDGAAGQFYRRMHSSTD